jgi:prepilin-type N-terminal cleavage/methylation domain-containing protein
MDMSLHQTIPARRRGHRRGFTLIEAAMVTVIIGVGVMATLQLVAAGTMANVDSSELTTGLHLAGNVREMMVDLKFKESATAATWGPEPEELAANAVKTAYDDVDDFDGKVFSPPLSGRRDPILSYANWTQALEVYSVDENLVTSKSGKDNVTFPMSRVVVRISRNGKFVHEASWLVVNTMN